MIYRKLWFGFFAVIVISFGVLGYFGSEIYHKAPPIPSQVVTTDGQIVYTSEDIKNGQNVWQSIGGQELCTVWGHGSYVAPDWTADWLHREALWHRPARKVRQGFRKACKISQAKSGAVEIKKQRIDSTNRQKKFPSIIHLPICWLAIYTCPVLRRDGNMHI